MGRQGQLNPETQIRSRSFTPGNMAGWDSEGGIVDIGAPGGGGGGSGGLTLLDADVAAGSVADLRVTSWLDAAYDNYAIKLSGVVPSAGCILQMDFSVDGGATWEASNYNWLWVYGASATGVIRVANDSQINFRDVDSTLDAGGSFNAMFDLFNPGGAASKQIIGQITIITNTASAPGLLVLSGGAFWFGSSAVNGVRIKPSAGTLLTGALRIYGYGN